MTEHRHPQSPLLDHCPEALPREAYLDAGWYAREMATVWAHNWVCVGRLDDVPIGTMRAVPIGYTSVLLTRLDNGGIRAYHNSCRHRGAELCAKDGEAGKLITCPYHAWAYSAADGRLVSTGYGTPTADFQKTDHGLRPVSHEVWNGFVFLNLSNDPRPLTGYRPEGFGQLADGPTCDRAQACAHSELQLEGLLGKLQRVPALSGGSS